MTILELLWDYLKDQGYHVTRSPSVIAVNQALTIHLTQTTQINIYHHQYEPALKLEKQPTHHLYGPIISLDLNDPNFFTKLTELLKAAT